MVAMELRGDQKWLQISQTTDSSIMNLRKNSRKSFFTLLEMIMVIAIIMLIAGLSFAYMGRMPAGLILTSTTGKVEQLLMSAHMQASLQGVQKVVVFDFEKNTLFVTDPSEEDQELEAAPDAIEDAPENLKLKGDIYRIPKNIEVEFPDYLEDIAVYSFFPDGSASGPEMHLTIKGHTMSITVSQLTGIVITKEIEED
jgi:Tfp pilus assembly protein FimT